MAQSATMSGNNGHCERRDDKRGSGNFAGFSRLI